MTNPDDLRAPAGDEPAEADDVTATEQADVLEDGAAAVAPSPDEDPAEPLQSRIDELTVDLQRVQAEYLNYKRRVDRDRELYTENATYKALTPVIEVLDTVDRAREAGEVEGGFAAVTEQLERAVASAGLIRFAEVGEPFDPNLHEALSNLGPDADATVTSIKVVVKSGYRIGERVVRAAQVLVVEPADG